MLQKNKYVNKKEAFRMKSFFNSLNKRTGGGVFSIVLLALLLSGCPGTIGPKEDTTPGENLDASTFGARFTYAIEDTAILTWNEVDYEGLAYYKVSAKNSITTDDTVITSGKINKGSTLEWKATGLIPVMYDFTIRGYDKNGKELFYSTVGKDVYISKGILQPQISDRYAQYTDSGIEISWRKVYASSGFKKIEILRADAEDGDYTVIETLTDFVSAEKYVVDQFDFGKTYYFKLTSYDINDKNLGTTDVFSVTTPELQAPAKVTGLTCDYSTYFDGAQITWNKIASASSYKIQVSKTSSFETDDILLEKEVTEESYFVQWDISSSLSVYVRVCAINEKGTGDYSTYKYASTASISSVKLSSVVSEQTRNSAKVVLKAKNSSSDLNLKEAKIFYSLLDKDKNVVKDFQESNEFELTNLEFANTTVFWGKIKIVYNKYDSTESSTWDKIYDNNSDKISVKTLSFPAPEGEWTATEIGRTSIKIQFPTLKSDQLFGVSASDIVYHVSAYKEESSFTYVDKETEAGNTDPLVIKGLNPGEKYSFKVYAKKNESASVAGDYSEASELFQLKTALTQPVIKTITETTQEAPYTHMKVTFDRIPEDTYEDIKYGIAWEIMGGTTISYFSQSSATDLSNVTSIEEKVNGGNKYHVILYAYENNEGKDTIVRSEIKPIQLNKIDDRSIAKGLYYTDSTDIVNYGNLVDIANPATWGKVNFSSFTPKSTTSNFSWGLMNPYAYDSNGTIAIKFTLTAEMQQLSFSEVKLYFVEQYYSWRDSTIGTTELAYGTKMYLIKPDGSYFKDDEDNDIVFCNYDKNSKASYSDKWKMPNYSATGTLSSTDTPSTNGLPILTFEPYMFNNSVYFEITVPAQSNGNTNSGKSVGFSYKY